MIIEIGKFLLSVIGGLFTRAGWVGIVKNWKGILGVALFAIAAIWLLLTFNPFDDSDRKAARAEAKAEKQAALACKAEVANAGAELLKMQMRTQIEVSKATEEVRATLQQELENLRTENNRLQTVISSTSRAYSPQTLKEMAR